MFGMLQKFLPKCVNILLGQPVFIITYATNRPAATAIKMTMTATMATMPVAFKPLSLVPSFPVFPLSGPTIPLGPS